MLPPAAGTAVLYIFPDIVTNFGDLPAYAMQLASPRTTKITQDGLQSCLKSRKFQTPFNKVSRSVRNTIHRKKHLKFAPVVELAKLKFTYITVMK